MLCSLQHPLLHHFATNQSTMSYNDRSRSPPRRAYSPSAPIYRSRSRSRSPPPPPRRYDERRDVPAPRDRNYHDRDRDYGHDDRVPPPRDRNIYDDRVPPPRRDRDYDDRVPPSRNRDRDIYDERPARNRDYDRPREREWDHVPRRGGERDHDAYHDDRGRRRPSEPSRDLIFLGLDPELTEKELEGFLRVEHGYTVESAKIVRERATGQSKCFGFAQFATLDQAKRFMDDQYEYSLRVGLMIAIRT